MGLVRFVIAAGIAVLTLPVLPFAIVACVCDAVSSDDAAPTGNEYAPSE